jgi:hypothetical protein
MRTTLLVVILSIVLTNIATAQDKGHWDDNLPVWEQSKFLLCRGTHSYSCYLNSRCDQYPSTSTCKIDFENDKIEYYGVHLSEKIVSRHSRPTDDQTIMTILLASGRTMEFRYREGQIEAISVQVSVGHSAHQGALFSTEWVCSRM